MLLQVEKMTQKAVEFTIEKGIEIFGAFFFVLLALAFMIFFLIKYLNKLENNHKLEREKWMNLTIDQYKTMNDLLKENNSLIRELKILIQSWRD
jgi:large-conductance mechanosensitive channel